MRDAAEEAPRIVVDGFESVRLLTVCQAAERQRADQPKLDRAGHPMAAAEALTLLRRIIATAG